MDRYSYEEIIESVDEDFQASFKLGDDHVAATMRLLGDFYKEIIQSSPVEKLMFYIAICLYLHQKGYSFEHVQNGVKTVLAEIPFDSFKYDLETNEEKRLQADLEQVKSLLD
ncbi:hypothetical protein [Aliikangiella maris]|uniref:Uncharacterized protein n=2 Tax=Aliikangiella maris TaxID=3162458 RepID=A0ABV3MS81_9GAMM